MKLLLVAASALMLFSAADPAFAVSNTTKGAVAGAVGGAIVAGPVGLVAGGVGGAVAGRHWRHGHRRYHAHRRH